jgi:hypothetical protein
VADKPVELYQLIGSALRDVAQARFMADLYSRQISYQYERDGVLRQFPVPRVDIDEAEIALHFSIREVADDPARRISRHAAIGSLFDQYSSRIVRETMALVRQALPSTRTPPLEGDQKAAVDNFERVILSDENRGMLSGRILQYFNEGVGRILEDDGSLKVAVVCDDINESLRKHVFTAAELAEVKKQFPGTAWDSVRAKAQEACQLLVEALSTDLKGVATRYPDYKIMIDLDQATLSAPGAHVSSIKIKGSIKDYKWAKVDVDAADLRSVRTLAAE